MSLEAVRDCMPVFFYLLRGESHPLVRIVLARFVFVYIHPMSQKHSLIKLPYLDPEPLRSDSAGLTHELPSGFSWFFYTRSSIAT